MDVGEFTDMEVHADTKEMKRLWGEVATLRAERATYQTQIDEYHHQQDIAR